MGSRLCVCARLTHSSLAFPQSSCTLTPRWGEQCRQHDALADPTTGCTVQNWATSPWMWPKWQPISQPQDYCTGTTEEYHWPMAINPPLFTHPLSLRHSMDASRIAPYSLCSVLLLTRVVFYMGNRLPFVTPSSSYSQLDELCNPITGSIRSEEALKAFNVAQFDANFSPFWLIL